MAKYDVTWQCGHSDTVQLYGKTDGRYEWIDQQRERLCPDCWKAQQAAQTATRAEAANLPALTGSDKQVAWALSIREKQLAAFDRWYADLLRRAPVEQQPIGETMRDELRCWLVSQDAARFWIDTREKYAPDFVKIAGPHCPSVARLAARA